MSAEDLASALKNAIDHGESLDKAAASLVNAGYNPQEVSAAMQIVSQMASSQPKKFLLNPTQLQTAQPIQILQRPQIQQGFSKLSKLASKINRPKSKGLVIASMTVVSLLILLLIGILFAILLG